MVDRRRLVAFWLARALDVEPGEDAAAAAAEEGAGVGSDSDMKDLLNSGLEVAGYGDGQRKGGVVLALFDGVDALSGDTQGGSELGLGEASSLAQTAHVIIHEPHHPGRGQTTHSCRSRIAGSTQSWEQPHGIDGGEHGDHPLVSQSPRERVSCLLDMSSVLDMTCRVKGASLEGPEPPAPHPIRTHQQKIQNRRGSGSILKILSMCAPPRPRTACVRTGRHTEHVRAERFSTFTQTLLHTMCKNNEKSLSIPP